MAFLYKVSSTKYAQFKTTKQINWTQENINLQALGKELIIFNNKFNQEAFTILIVYLNNGMSIKRKITLVGIYKYPNCVKYNRTIYSKEDY